MSEAGVELRSISWTSAFPFVRLVRTVAPSLHFTRLVLAFLCVMVCYLGGRTLDALWGQGGAVLGTGARFSADSEIDAYSRLSASDFQQWKRDKLALPAEGRAVHGPFISLLDYEQRCFAGAIHGLCTGRIGFSGSAATDGSAMIGSIVSAGSGVAWLVTQRPFYATLYGVIHILAFAFFGGAICRHAAIQSARDESISMGTALGFAQEKFAQLALAPGILIAVLAGLGLLLTLAGMLAGVLSAIPLLGHVLAGALYILALLGGIALSAALIGLVTGVHLMAPTIAAEGSDAFDAMSRAISYVLSRPWHFAFYWLVTLVYGGLAFVFVRVAVLLMLKLTHVFTSAGMSFFGAWSSVETSSVGRLDALWRMPSWAEMSLLPSAGSMPFWGTFDNAPLSWGETAGLWLIAMWVFLVVGLVGAFVVSFYFAACTEMYFLLRRNVDAIEYDDVFYEEEGDEVVMAASAEAVAVAPASSEGAERRGTPLPVVGTGQSGGA